MKLIIFIFLFVSLLFSSDINRERFSEKLIVTFNKHEKLTQESLLKLKVYFRKNSKMKYLKKIYNLQIDIEKLGDYNVVTIKPIESISIRNKLIILLKPMFNNIYFIDYKPKIKDIIKNNKKSFISEIGLEWVALLFLSFFGLILSILTRKRMITMDEKQKDLSLQQHNIEKNIKNMGVNNV